MHWSREEILGLSHLERIRWGGEISKINRKLNDEPESTLLVLVSAFAGREHILAAYRHAVQERYRFFSYGDATFLK